MISGCAFALRASQRVLAMLASSRLNLTKTVRIEVGFEPHSFERRLVRQTRTDIRNRLHGHELDRLKIVLRKAAESRRIAFQFVGDPESREKAKRLLGIY